jgi:hypothetical protein
MEQKEARGNLIVMLVVAVLMITGSVWLYNSCESVEYDTAENTSIDADVEVEFYVKKRLKSPSTADFGYANVSKLSKDRFKVSNTVDSQNSFGGMVRMNYSCVIEFNETGGYKVEDFLLE